LSELRFYGIILDIKNKNKNKNNMPNPIYIPLSKQVLPTPNDKNQAGFWGFILNDYLKQIGSTENGGGLNTFATDPVKSPRDQTKDLSSSDNGYTYINSKYNEVRKYDQGKWMTIMSGNNIWNNSNRPSPLDITNTGLSGLNTELKQIEKWDGTNWVQVLSLKSISASNVMFGFELDTATAGDHFLYNSSGGTHIIQIPQGSTSGKIDNANLYVNAHNAAGFPASPTVIKLFKKPSGASLAVEIANFTVPANTNSSSSPISIPLASLPNVTLAQGDKIYVNLSQACLDVDFTIAINLIFS
jgi:hypothetical protein